jgi:glycosyltransferase involved in cell wall biosynthesis
MALTISATASAIEKEKSRRPHKMPDAEERLRVLHYIAGFEGTGVETFVLQLCSAQKRADLLPAIVLDLKGREASATGGSGIAIHALPFRQPGEMRLPKKLGTALLRLRRIRRLIHLLRNSDVLHIHEGSYGLEAFVAARIVGCKAIIVTHHVSLTIHSARWRWPEKLTFWLEKRWARRIILPYQALAEEYVGAGVSESRAGVAPFCADERLFTGIAAEPTGGVLKLVMAARLVEGKGHTELFSAIARLRPRYPGLQLQVIGDGPMRPELEAEVARLGLRQVIEFKGYVDLVEAPALLRSCHVIVLPSYMPGETFPVCLLEGMALGLPAIGTRWFGIPDIIADGETGILIEPRDVDALTTAIERFLTDPEFYSRARKNALVRFGEQFTSTAVTASYSSFYEAAMRQ